MSPASPVPKESVPLNHLLAEIASYAQQARAISVATIAVSFVHMFFALALFSASGWVDRVAAMAMTALVDVVTWFLGRYLHYARKHSLERAMWVQVLFGLALLISMLLNFVYLYVHRPLRDLEGVEVVALLVPILFAIFVPATIAVLSLVEGELEGDRLLVLSAALPPPAPVPAPAPSHDPLPPPAPALPDPGRVVPFRPRASNGKADVPTDDLPAIYACWFAAGSPPFTTGSELSKICGWSSSSSTSRAMRLLRESGLIETREGEDGRSVMLLREPGSTIPLDPAP